MSALRTASSLEELGQARANEEAAVVIAHDRIADVERVGRGGRDTRATVSSTAWPSSGVAKIAREHRLGAVEAAALLDPGQYLAHGRHGQDIAAPGAVARVVAEQHGVDRPDLVAQPLQRKDRGTVADMTIGHGRLDRDDTVLHRRFPRQSRSVGPRLETTPIKWPLPAPWMGLTLGPLSEEMPDAA